MNELIPSYAIFSIAALLAKIGILSINFETIKKANYWFLSFFVGLFGINLIELVGFYYPSADQLALFLITLYYLFVMLMAMTLLGISAQIAGRLSKNVTRVIQALLALSCLVLVIPGAALAGVQSIGYTYTRIAGPLYWVVQILLVGALLASVSLLAVTAKYGKDLLSKRKAKALLVAIIPIVVVSVGVVILMQFGLQVTGSVVGSFAILFFLIVFVIIENEQKLFGFLSFVPATAEFKLATEARSALSRVGSADLQSVVTYFEKAIINDALDKCEGNKTSAADMLGISRTTLRRKLEAAA
ncbi:hypothetical protein NBRC116493_22870 [Aurantivibrio infirmus]